MKIQHENVVLYAYLQNVYSGRKMEKLLSAMLTLCGSVAINHRNNELHELAKELLTSEEGLKHRSKKPIEPEAVFGQIKYDNSFKRFHYRGRRLVKAEFATIAHNIRKMISNGHVIPL